ncbi:acetyl/propionyl/methylcrotonyl-CoA carboxylase subunit alpha [Limibaculum sp. M0105]|uniref:Acetyl/propionyl/methylcrotonyl-CoA carboxylase subunit alpha n=1 Tax=Thermohalobaculum xanthum TaxID=2753746 RepID=A0A8J7M448_9RHOB|nr:acetyl/propionyl/methylcrotonyl-CoA carboxylase subunit alpha [Thermohalobaculum xanthum]MBK0398036.1 acetyl/propionyl/methylcrotonyl-CoA carboxylase subunit alpha [Thermohalobaculum xanthum]
MFRKILIANRGEIAVRIARTARAMGIATVAVHSDADADAQHVLACDEAVRIGPAPVAESYLKAERILAAARDTGAEAIHPGYGFLSENPGFAEAVEAAGLVFIGPPASAIRAMGLKDASKRLMEDAGVPVTPGYHGDDQDPAFLAEQAARIGFPVLIKAAAGGGGKGMRRVDDPAQFAEALARAKSEAASSFGNETVLIEKYILNPRHIEVQVFADAHGNIVHLYERDCSAQRRHQKVIEEAPAPGMTPEVRAAMTRAATRAAEAVGYRGAGTVEFIVDGSGALRPDGFWFMEMNTRLQVEHPVTEAVTGLDLVEWQLRVAAGEPLPLAQDQIPLNGHAVEARIYAEDPARDFMPQTGRLSMLRFPGGARVDTGVAEGDTVTPHYDPMIAKVITAAPDRAGAFGQLADALAATEARGCVTNIAFLGALATDEDMLAGRIDTGLIARRIDPLTARPEAGALDLGIAAAAITGMMAPRQMTGWRAWGPGRSFVIMTAGDERLTVALTPEDGGLRAETPLGAVGFRLSPLGGTLWQVTSGEGTRRVHVHLADEVVTLASAGRRLTFARDNPLVSGSEDPGGGDHIAAPLPGLVKSVAVAPGDTVTAGQAVAVMEAMKMEHTLLAPRDGTVAEVAAKAGEQVAEGALLIALEPAS